MTAVNATVRLQFHREFTLDDAVPLVSYFHRLGITHIYASPLLKARAGSMHGYDVVDPTCINPELGGEAALERLVAELRLHRMGLIVDIVCNHMAVGRDDNPWWQDVLRWGLKSPYARFFDIQWNSPDPLLKGQLLLPFLSDSYGDVLAAGKITLDFDAKTGEFFAQHYDHRFPINPPSYGHILRNAQDDALSPLILLFEALEQAQDDDANVYTVKELQQHLSKLAQQENIAASIARALSYYQITAQEDISAEKYISAIEQEIQYEKSVRDAHETELRANDQSDSNLQRLHELLELQHYRLASWRTAADDINWRRFFDVNELAGIRIERTEVFEASHAKIFELIARGWIDGLRIDHIDGLANPRAYCRKLRRRLDRLRAQRPTELAQDPLPIFVEKILAENETLNSNWTVDGTTGYEFMNQISLLQHDPRGALHLFDLWTRISCRTGTFSDETKEARRLVLSSSLAGDVEMVAQNLLLIARNDIATRDLPLGAIRRALLELVVNFPVYRTYSNACGRSPQDQEFFNQASIGARATLAESDWPILDYLDRWLGGDALHALPPGPTRNLRRKTVARFQQLTSPAAAKAVEDTACYRSAVLLSRNDVGFDPQHFSAPLAQFHQQNIARAKTFPKNLLTTATHDHKRGEDTRARLAVISERSMWFANKIDEWQLLAAPLRASLEDGIVPSPGDEMMLYQTLLGTWPLGLSADDTEGLKGYLTRILRWQEKAVREAKLRSSWSAPNAAYESASRDFVTRLLSAEDTHALRADIAQAAHSLAPAGALNSLSQTLLRMTVPGIPDLYQGNELWDFSLVDPDNRQPVDFGTRVAALPGNRTSAELVANWQDGQIKQWLIAETLQIRQQYAHLFRNGDYQALSVEGEGADQVVAFTRQYQNNYLVVVAPRFGASLLGDNPTPHIPPKAWGETRIVLPPALKPSSHILVDSFAPVAHRPVQDSFYLRDVLANFPVNFLVFELTFPSPLTPTTPSYGDKHHEHS